MPKFVISKGHDAFAYYETVVEADTPDDARRLARSVHYDGEWHATGYVQEFDDYEIDEHSGVRPLDDGETIEPFQSIGVIAHERDAILAACAPASDRPARDENDQRCRASSPRRRSHRPRSHRDRCPV